MTGTHHFIKINTRHLNNRFLLGTILFWGVATGLILTLVLTDQAVNDPLSKLYILPWCIATGLSIVSPIIYLKYRGEFSIFSPLVYAAWVSFFPGFVIGGLLLCFGTTQPFYLSFIQDEYYNFPLTFGYIIIGFLALSLGFLVPFSQRLGARLGRRLPAIQFSENQIPKASLILLFLGLASVSVMAFFLGIYGYYRVESSIGIEGFVYTLTLWIYQASFLFWVHIFRLKYLRSHHYFLCGLSIFLTVMYALFAGSRGSLVYLLFPIIFAFGFSGKRIEWKHYSIGVFLLAGAMLVGLIFGTTFREMRDRERQTTALDYATDIPKAFVRINETDVGDLLSNSFFVLANRMESVSSLAVIVSNYEVLAPYEEQLGINDNIFVDSVTFFIPRIIWRDKPGSVDPAKYGDLYFNYSENSFAVTPIGDLLRNFGPFGVPIGMFILGFILRVIYASLVENQAFSYWRSTLYFMLIMTINYEGTFGSIVPFMFKIGSVTLLGIFIVWFFARIPANRNSATII